eukprot:8314293-Ditylum_brightwellii.AAC.2
MHNMENGAHTENGTNDTTGVMIDDNGVDLFSVKGDRENNECSNCRICDYDGDNNATTIMMTL